MRKLHRFAAVCGVAGALGIMGCRSDDPAGADTPSAGDYSPTGAATRASGVRSDSTYRSSTADGTRGSAGRSDASIAPSGFYDRSTNTTRQEGISPNGSMPAPGGTGAGSTGSGGSDLNSGSGGSLPSR